MYTISFVFQISIKDNGVPLLLGTLAVITHMVMQVGAFAATSFFPSGFHILKTNALVSVLEQFNTFL